MGQRFCATSRNCWASSLGSHSRNLVLFPHIAAATDATATSERIEREGGRRVGNLSLGPKNGIFSLYLSLGGEPLSLSRCLCASGRAGGGRGRRRRRRRRGGAHLQCIWAHFIGVIGHTHSVSNSLSLSLRVGKEMKEL